MLKKYKNRFLKFIKEFDLGTVDFEVELLNVENSGQSICLKIKESDFFFQINSYAGDWDLFWIEFRSFTPTFPVQSWPPSTEYLRFEECLKNLEMWKKNDLDEYLAEKNRPDLLKKFC